MGYTTKGPGIEMWWILLGSSPVPRPFIQCMYIASSITHDTESVPCWGWFGSGTETSQDLNHEIVFAAKSSFSDHLVPCGLLSQSQDH